MLLIVPSVQSLLQLYAVFAVMSIGLAMGVGPILTKVISSWFYARRGLTLGLNSSAGSFGALILVPTASVFLILLTGGTPTISWVGLHSWSFCPSA